MIGLHQLAPYSRTPRKRIGRGHGTGQGTFAGKGTKGQRARTGGRKRLKRRSLKSLIERLPKVRGGSLTKPAKPATVSVAELDRVFDAGSRITKEQLVAKRLLPSGQDIVVVLGGASMTKALTVEAHRFSGSARDAITKAGGTVIRLSVPEPRRPKPRRPRE